MTTNRIYKNNFDKLVDHSKLFIYSDKIKHQLAWGKDASPTLK